MHTLICLVRHGVTTWNYDGRAQGLSDIPLAPEGVLQAEAVAERLSAEPWDAIYSSTLGRAYQTALTIARRTGHAEVRPDTRLVERSMGGAEGLTNPDRIRRFPGLSWDAIPDAEPVAAVTARANAALAEIAGQYPGGRVVCVTHGAVIHHFLRSLASPDTLPPRHRHQRNTAVSLIRYDGQRFTLESPPDHRHILQDGIEYSGERGRVTAGQLAPLLAAGYGAPDSERIVWEAVAIEAAWVDEQLVGFVRASLSTQNELQIDMSVASPHYSHVLPHLRRRLAIRYPGHRTA